MNRVIPGLLLATAWLLLVSLAPIWLFALVLLAGAALALHEYFRMSFPALRGGKRLCAIFLSLLPVLAACSAEPSLILFALFLCVAGFIGLGLVYYGDWEPVSHFLGSASFASLYIGLCSACLMLLRQLPHGSFWLILLTAIIAGSDTGAYYAGRRWGRRRIFPRLSPKKTLAGVVGGTFCGVGCALLITLLLDGPIGLRFLVPIAVLLVVVGIAGDLAESMLKRLHGIKDSGSILAGHGGLLDRIDSLLLSAPVLYFLLMWQGMA